MPPASASRPTVRRWRSASHGRRRCTPWLGWHVLAPGIWRPRAGAVHRQRLEPAGPPLIHWGTEEQKKPHLPRILSADELWCEGYSELDAGGDLASLRTRAVDHGNHFLVNGQKVWTSRAHFADWFFLLVRTDPDAPKHHGISYLLVDMKTPGITPRPLVLLNGHRHFNEVFF